MAITLSQNPGHSLGHGDSHSRKAPLYTTGTDNLSNNQDFDINMPPSLQKKALLNRGDRTSFSSIKESDSGVAQSFTTTRTSSYLSKSGLEDEVAVDFDGQGSLTNPQSQLHGWVCPCEGFRGWKGISLRGKVVSRSHGDLRKLGRMERFDWDVKKDEGVEMEMVEGKRAGDSPMELLPVELLSKFILIIIFRLGKMLYGFRAQRR